MSFSETIRFVIQNEKSQQNYFSPVLISIDGYRLSDAKYFSYLEDPYIHKISPAVFKQ